MSKSSQRKKKGGQSKLNAANTAPHPGLRNVDKGSQYVGAARFIEIAPPGVAYRATANVDHITDITFAEKTEEIEIRDEGGVGIAEVLDEATGEVLEAAVPPPTHMERQVTGYVVCVQVAGRQNEFTYARVEVAIAFYNQLLATVAAVGVPCALQNQLMPPPPPPEEATNDDAVPGDEDLDDPLIDELEDIADEAEEAVDEPTQH